MARDGHFGRHELGKVHAIGGYFLRLAKTRNPVEQGFSGVRRLAFGKRNLAICRHVGEDVALGAGYVERDVKAWIVCREGEGPVDEEEGFLRLHLQEKHKTPLLETRQHPTGRSESDRAAVRFEIGENL